MDENKKEVKSAEVKSDAKITDEKNNKIKNIGNKNEKEKTEKKKSKKKLIISIILGVIIVIAVVIGYFIYMESQIELLDREISNSLEILGTVYNEDGTINNDVKISTETKTRGKFAIVEEAFKKYINDIAEVTKKAEDVFNSESLENILDEDNLENDGPDFTQTKEKIMKSKTDSEEYIDKVLELCSKEKILTLLDEKTLSEYYKETYKEAIEESEEIDELEKARVELQYTKTEVAEAYDYVIRILTFLSDNKSSWKMEDGQIAFTSQSKLNEFNQLLDEAPEFN